MAERVYNFASGPAVLPLPAMEEAQRDLLALPGVGSSILEISHRSKPFLAIIEAAEANLRQLLGIPGNYKVLFLQGGARLQFAILPMNFLPQGSSADYVLAGTWGRTANTEALTQGKTRVVWDGQACAYRRMPAQEELDLDPGAAYLHITSNETIQGIQISSEPDSGNVPLFCDSSSDFLHRKVPVERYGVLYACAQKNAGPAGVTIAIIREDLFDRVPAGLPSLLSYKAIADAGSLLNTPPCFAVYMVKLVTDWLLRDIGGLDRMHAINKEKAAMLYEAVDGSGGFYKGHAEPAHRSLMNVTFTLPNEDAEKAFHAGAAKLGLMELKGHRSVGGCRASIYNAMPREGVVLLRDYMVDFAKKNG
ncbi:MAG: 3-phosphoserine/phosphohydroxythreonine transaminase [Pirellulaceae bacterium]|jgi:phosphoserine aminotransferase|nr:3-phosphoserine/phosphohydroxythreonine transaminase [Thermoguttaceae bacterium]MDI9442995.1 3-phosphoserine/phosphohydroxythreonine transaminase [Planctomycetota bacterium]NLZ01199.1 3-phosphoserine/phosphohydroxythreonine transaminase [Pirellulaceae bacterium]